MSGTAIIWYLLKSNSPVLAALGGVSPAARIVEDDHFQQNTAMPALLITKIDRVNPHRTIRENETPRIYSERVQVTALVNGQEGTPQGGGRKGVDSLLRLVHAACPSQRGTVNGYSVDSITWEGEGPDLSDTDTATALYSGSVDFIVKWVSAT